MTKTFTRAALILIAVALLPASVMANMSKHEKESVEKTCKAAIAKKGYKDYTYKYTEIMDVRAGGYTMTGQLHKDGKRFGYNCLVGKDMKITDLGIDKI